MHKRAVEHMLEAELDAHLDYEKHDKSKDGNYRNGYGAKKIKSSLLVNVRWHIPVSSNRCTGCASYR